MQIKLWISQVCTIPLDTAKVRLQLQKSAIAGDVTLPKYRGLLGTVGTIAREEGLRSLWKGVVPGLHRQCLFGGLRIGMYEPVGSQIYLYHSLENRSYCSKSLTNLFSSRSKTCTLAKTM